MRAAAARALVLHPGHRLIVILFIRKSNTDIVVVEGDNELIIDDSCINISMVKVVEFIMESDELQS